MKGFPWWPGRIANESRASRLQLAGKKPGTHYILFFGDNQYSEDGQMGVILSAMYHADMPSPGLCMQAG